jgi:hypothetical protein
VSAAKDARAKGASRGGDRSSRGADRPVGAAGGAAAPAQIQWPADRVERRPIAQLLPYARNARTHTDAQVAQIAAAMREWGWTMPVLAAEDGSIIAGHGRVMAARLLDLDLIPTMTARGWSEAQIKAYRLWDNQSATLSSWNPEFLGLELIELRDLGAKLELTGFEPVALHDLMAAAGGVERIARLPPLPNGDRNPFQEMTFILHDDQVEIVKAALDLAKQQGAFEGANQNSNGNALARICEDYHPDA